MERDHDEAGLIELGTASTVTKGQSIPADPESDGYRLVGLIAD